MTLGMFSSQTIKAGDELPSQHPQIVVKAGRSSDSSRPSSTTSGPTHASLAAQAGALYRKNAAYQRRNIWSNVCLLASPVLFCVALLVVQVLVSRMLLSTEDYECGCQCTKCCLEGNCSSVSSGTCAYECLEFNRSVCGIDYSTARQAAFCEIAHPSSWPSILQTPPEQERAAPYRPKAAFLYTGADEGAARALTEGMLNTPGFTASDLLAAQHYLEAFTSEMNQSTSTVIPGELLSVFGMRLGTSSYIQAGLYMETALIGGSPTLYSLWPDGTCAAMGLEGQMNISLSTVLQAMINTSNSEAVASALNERLHNITGALAGGSGASSTAAAKLVDLKLNCTDVVLSSQTDAAALQRTLYCGYLPARCDGSPAATNAYAAGFDWRDTDDGNFGPALYYNDTYGQPRGNDGTTAYQRVPQVLNMAINSWLRNVLGDGYSAELIGVLDMPRLPMPISMDLGDLLGPLFATWIVMMTLPIFLMQLVYEKEKRLRMMMTMHGLGDTAYWVVMYSWFLLLYVVYMASFVLVGYLTGLHMFTHNNFGIQFGLYFLFGNTMIASAFLLSCFFSSTRTATVFAYLVVFGTGLIGHMLLTQLINAGSPYTLLVELVPSFALFRGLYELSVYASLGVQRGSSGMTAASLYDRDNGMLRSWVILAVEWVVSMLLAWYLEQVYASGTGNRRHPLFFFLDLFARKQERKQPSSSRQPRPSNELQLPKTNTPNTPVDAAFHKIAVHGAGLGTGAYLGASGAAAAAAAAAAPEYQEPWDVAAEHVRVNRLADYSAHPIVVRELNKVYPRLDGQAGKVAVHSLNLAIGRGECFGLLGPNGAGKSTSINMMVGLMEPTAGTALIGGHDITTDKDAIYSMMGVCPQHDLLWETLTGREHLMFYGRLKGLQGPELESAVEAALRSVNLWNNKVCDKQAGHYSGGMKRRLSVAISFMGDPLVVYLDEPSTGLDPASRRNLWDVVKKHKAGRSIVLTTHSMEEAEMLCDRLGIFVDGRLVCIGSPKDITSRHSGYLVFTITVAAGQEAAACALVASMSPSAQLTYSVAGTLKFELPTSEVSLSRVFATMSTCTASSAAAAGTTLPGTAAADATAAGQVTVLDWGVASATLEEVFIRFARQINAKAG